MALITLFMFACLASPLLHSNSATATAASSALVNPVCDLTTNSAFCHALLDPFNSTTDPYELADVVFGFTYYNATSTKDYIHLWLRSNGNNTKPDMRDGMLECEGYYKQAISALQKVSKDLEKRYSKRLGELATYVEEGGLGCEVAFTHGYPDDIIAKKNQNFIILADICVIVSGLFAPIVN
ncbi:uncharacterized protein [Primulina huaijiensis]|uniref:uncharacterized protein n=1 Tax=Primulina huaijiensis TaxID=1492673 RepID=UPI003CC6E566